MTLFDWLRSQRRSAWDEVDATIVAADDVGVRVSRPNGIVEKVDWDDLTEVAIVTSGEGPIAEDVFFVLTGGNSRCIVPHSKATNDLYSRLAELPGYNFGLANDAMKSYTNQSFRVWAGSAKR